MIHSILVPLDGSEFAEHALPAALALARRTGASLHLAQVHVPLPDVEGAGLLSPEVDQRVRDAERAYLDRAVRRVAAVAPVAVTAAVPVGAVGDELVGAARACAADLVVMTTHGRGAFSRFWLGSVADELVRRGPTPVLLLRPPDGRADLATEPALRHLLVPLDGTPQAEQVLESAADLATVLGARITILRVVRPVAVPGYDLAGYASAGADLLLLEQQQRTADDYLRRVREWFRERRLDVEMRRVVHDQPAAAILETARDDGCDLIALATHGRGGLARVLLGSVADKVVRGATGAVFVYRAPPDPALAGVVEARTAVEV